MNNDWTPKQPVRHATLLLNNKKFTLNVRCYQLETVHIATGLAILPASNTTDILSIKEMGDGWDIEVQTTRTDNRTSGAIYSQN